MVIEENCVDEVYLKGIRCRHSHLNDLLSGRSEFSHLFSNLVYRATQIYLSWTISDFAFIGNYSVHGSVVKIIGVKYRLIVGGLSLRFHPTYNPYVSLNKLISFFLYRQAVNIEELTLQSVVRKKRQADDGQNAGVPIYEQAYGLPPRSTAKGLRLYGDFLAGSASESPELGPEVTESPIKPYHRDGVLDPTGAIVLPMNEISSMWVPKERRRYSSGKLSSRNLGNELDGSEESDAEVIREAARSQVLRRRSRVKSLQGPGRSVRRRQKSRTPSNTKPAPVFFREGLVKQDRAGKKIPRKKQSQRRRRTNPVVTVAHFVATPANRTAHHHAGVSEDVHGEWSPAAWMDKLGLNRKYSLRRGVVTVKESGLYYLYAQVLYQPGRFGSGFQVVVDSIPIMECTLAPAQPSPSCHTGGATYLPRNAAVYIRDLDHHMTAVKNEENSFFGLVKLMDAPATAEKLLLG
ncbi:uncharacterized protein LOC119578458 [Penaeus monodon]|uniref:uncharacterized protein LOC119578458 n=1 Tax=Penaeus monodon TaxID=6687 RepID=UPI0018A718B9|nr:uncharacterized protein LOC119578458 [Penaeus monodon]